MTLTKTQIGWLGAGALWAVASGFPAVADDTEIFVGTASSGALPNILFVIDDSISMNGQVLTQAPYDPATPYAGSCDETKVYWRSGSGGKPACSTSRWFDLSALKCDAAIQAFATAGSFIATRAAQYDPTNSGGGRQWKAIDQNQHTRVVECSADAGVHGDGVSATNLWARNGQAQAAPGTGYWGTVGQQINWNSGSPLSSTSYELFSGHYLNYWYANPPVMRSRLEIVQDVATDLLDTISGVNVGMMDFNTFGDFVVGSEGGRVSHAMENIATARVPLKATINALTPNAATPLAETMYEATRYFRGTSIVHGTTSVAASREPVPNTNLYNSPIDFACQKNFVVYLTDGEPTWDNSSDAAIATMQDANGATFGSLVGATCDAEVWAGIDFAAPPSGQMSHCFDDVAEFLQDGDLSALPGQQNVTTYTVGFTVDLPLLAEAAQRGGGDYYTANDAFQLTSALTNIVTSILASDTTFTSPTVAVNAFNRTENLSDLFVSVFKPAAQTHWPGNLKKYRLDNNGGIVDADGQPAIDPATGFFSPTARSYWSAPADGSDVTAGGAANVLPTPAARAVYTNIGAGSLAAAGNRVAKTNAAITDALLGTGGAGDPTRDEVIDFANGLDLPDTDQDNVTNEPRMQLGDPLHAQPASVVYGPGLRDGLIFFATNDGFLHAVDIATGIEEWAFIPREFLDDQTELYKNDPASTKHYGIDGNLRVFMKADGDNVMEAGEKVYLFFGMRRGGNFYYGLDVTDPDAPTVLWRADGTTLPGIGQSWSTPMPTRIDIQGAPYDPANVDKRVLVMGGGYEPDQDSDAASTDTVGNSIYIVDMVSGALLWHGSLDGVHKDFNAAGKAMNYSIPGDIRVLDINNDGLADRMYAADMGGQVWRFDISNGQTAANLIAGGVIAQLGAAPLAGPPLQDVRRFYYAPDVAFVNTRTDNFIHVGLGSGHREHPLGTAARDRYYALRDYGFGPKAQAQFNAIVPTTDAQLTPITAVGMNIPKGSKGWRLDLNLNGWIGEKVLAEARTVSNQVFFSTYRPGSSASSCTPQAGTNRHYQMSLLNGSPVLNLDGSVDPNNLTLADISVDGIGGSISTATQVLFLSTDRDQDGTPDNVDTDDDGDGILDVDDADPNGDLADDDNDGIPNGQDDDDDNDGTLDEDEDNAWVCTDLACVRAGFDNNPVRTFWSQESLD